MTVSTHKPFSVFGASSQAETMYAPNSGRIIFGMYNPNSMASTTYAAKRKELTSGTHSVELGESDRQHRRDQRLHW